MKKTNLLIGIILFVVSVFAGYFLNKNNFFNLSRQKETTELVPQAQSPTSVPTPSFPSTLGNFLVTDREICKEEEKPSVYFFGSASCPHCVWEKPVVKEVFDQFKDEIAYHENFDASNDSEVLMSYSDINPGYIPFLVLGCKYARVGAGENLGTTDAESQKLEKEALSAILCKLTDGKPASVCDLLKEKTSQVK